MFNILELPCGVQQIYNVVYNQTFDMQVEHKMPCVVCPSCHVRQTEFSICVVQEFPCVTDINFHVGQTRIAIWNEIKVPLIVECIEQVVVDSNYQLPCSTY